MPFLFVSEYQLDAKRLEKNTGVVAQLGEHLPCTQGVGSSILPGSTNECSHDKSDQSRILNFILACFIGKLIKNMVEMCVHKHKASLKKYRDD